MAEFGTKLTDLGTTNFTGYAKQGVVDKSKAMETESKFSLGTQAVEYGIDKLKEYDKYQTLKGVAEEIGGIMQEQEDRSYLGQAALAEDQEALKAEMGFAQDQVGYDGSYPSVLNQELTDNTRGVTNALADTRPVALSVIKIVLPSLIAEVAGLPAPGVIVTVIPDPALAATAQLSYAMCNLFCSDQTT